MYLKTNETYEGPFCKDSRPSSNLRSRRALSKLKDGKGMVFDGGKGMELIYNKNGGFKFLFNFDFEWELLPGLPTQNKISMMIYRLD